VFSVTRLNEHRRREEPSPFEVLLVAERADALRATGGMRVIPDCTLETCPPLDILLVPGVSRICGDVVGRATARHMEYPYPDDNTRRVALP
jgi:hypothetical protein